MYEKGGRVTWNLIILNFKKLSSSSYEKNQESHSKPETLSSRDEYQTAIINLQWNNQISITSKTAIIKTLKISNRTLAAKRRSPHRRSTRKKNPNQISNSEGT
ncbi:hypothetical protein VIGAN_08232100 [Vigna angularis var. angularis]|uniref:Uncharacterized protein n=1 Tax=Vigna angularis var. angularis TaxID=157739 RepID=A0A0S3SRV9_PHAAN|nr:hypothetical protein VIGAN_08232100 [Vigna angularis var. angularis]